MSKTDRHQAGVIGVGAMGQHHARVYDELAGVELVGVADADEERASEISDTYDTDAFAPEKLIEAADSVTVAVPTAYHYDLAKQCIAAETDLLIEKPFVDDPENGEALIEAAAAAGVTLQVGHIERFNPVTQTLQEIVPDLDVIAVDANRLGPQPDRRIEDSAVTDLMIHDIDVICSLLESSVESVTASGNADGRHATATMTFEDGTVADLTASRVTQRKVRELTITAEQCYVVVDYLDQSVEIHRQSVPEYVAQDGDVRYRHESIVENPAVDNGEPLKHELRAFVDAAQSGETPRVSGADGLRALELAQAVNRKAFGDERKIVGATR